jgi:hypothetical protein
MIVSKLQVLGRGLQRQLLKLQLMACPGQKPSMGQPISLISCNPGLPTEATECEQLKKRDSIASGAFVDALWTHCGRMPC